MNNIDKLRNIIMRKQKLLHPHGQEIMEVIHAFNQNEANLRDYIQRIKMNELEFNAYDEDNNSIVTFAEFLQMEVILCMFTTFFEVYEDLMGKSHLSIILTQKKKDGPL
ncbi:hypothetical protein C1645_842593 [Glomus cerebriforme]|uniref:EF-hand domain-containing protein n=1 Tax=Glomus cerebriforme TaxID=658196 RepID=A0A397RWZ4_9GLOM|nr:hypothetical protein C1645_842593 [Glomus cerebriforme]